MSSKLIISELENAKKCSSCSELSKLDFEFEYAFQPIVDLNSKSIYGHEALVRGTNGEPADSILSRLNENNIYRFDQTCRVKAVKTAAELGLDGQLAINFLPNAVQTPELCIRTTLAAAAKYNFPATNIIFEFTEGEQISDLNHLQNIIASYQELGFKTAIDDFGAGYAGLSLLARFQPDIVKIDMDLLHNIDSDRQRQVIVRSLVTMCHELEVTIIAEGVRSAGERDFLADLGINLMQGYLFASPAFKSKGAISETAWI